MHRFHVVALCLTFSMPAWPQATLSGRVLTRDGEPVPGATVRIEERNLSAVAGEDGAFHFPELPASAVTVFAGAPGFYMSRKTVVPLDRNPGASLEIRLEPREAVRQSMVVTGTQSEHLEVDAPVRTNVITGIACERNVSRTLSEALTSTVSGVRVEANCQNCGFLAVRLNGLEGQYTQVLEDGLPAYSGVSMVYALEQIPTEFVDTIEVVKGGASSLYGPNAVAGVINLVRREPQSTRFTVDTQGGWQHGRPESSAGASAQVNELPWELSGDLYFRALRRTPIDRNDDGFSDMPRRRMTAGGGTLYRRFLSGRARLAAGATVIGEFRRGGDRLHLAPAETEITEMADSRRSGGFFRFNHTLNASSFYNIASSLHYLRRHTYYGAGYDPNAYGDTGNPLWVSDAQLGHQRGRHTLLAGYQFQRERVRDHIPAYARAFDNTFLSSGIYVQDEWSPVAGLAVVAGLRADKSSTLGNWVFSPRGNVRYGLNDHWNVRAGISTGFRAPVIFDEDLHVTAVGGQGFVLQNAPGLREERSRSYNASLDYLGSLAGRPFQSGLSFFWTALSGVHVLRESPLESGYRLFERVNGAGSRVRGAEIDWAWSLDKSLTWRGGWTLQQSRLGHPEPRFDSLRYFRTPSSYGFTGIEASLPFNLSVIANCDFTGRMLVPHYAGYIPEDRLERTPSFTVFNVVLGKTLDFRDSRKVRFYVRAGNLLDRFQPDLDRGPQRDSGYFYGPTAMRSVAAGMTVSF